MNSFGYFAIGVIVGPTVHSIWAFMKPYVKLGTEKAIEHFCKRSKAPVMVPSIESTFMSKPKLVVNEAQTSNANSSSSSTASSSNNAPSNGSTSAINNTSSSETTAVFSESLIFEEDLSDDDVNAVEAVESLIKLKDA